MAGSRKSLLRVEPGNELEFYGPFTAVQSSTISLINPTEDRVTFKVKTTVPKRYCVRPSCGIVEANETVKVAVMLQPFDCDGSEKNKHKFMIQSMVLDGDHPDNLEYIWKEANSSMITDARLKCTLRMPDDLLKVEPSELIFEGPISESSNSVLTAKNTSPKDVCFKIRTNAPKRFVVTPNEGVVKAHESQTIKIATVAGVEPAGETRDRIAVMSTLVPEEMTEPLDQIWNIVDKAKISEKILMCTFPGTEQTPLPSSTSKLAQLTQEIENLRRENKNLKERQNALLKQGSPSNVPLGSAANTPIDTLRMNVPPILYLLVTFLFALAVGKFML